jgi:deoxyribose-phosphate aldolase
MVNFFAKAQGPLGHVAAVCVLPHFVRQAVTEFAGTKIQVATVANFPEGTATLETVLIEIARVLQDGAQEIDVVFPYHRYLAGERQYAQQFIAACKAVCGHQVILKVILETGVLMDPAIIADASLDALTGGADFIKSSTGRVTQGATLEAAAAMLLVIRHAIPKLDHMPGIKVSGGIKDIEQAAHYLALADNIMGRDWVTSKTFRIGTSTLVDKIGLADHSQSL